MAFSPETFAILNGKIKTLQSEVDDLSSATKWLGVTTTPLRDGATTSSILINDQYVTVKRGNIAAYNNTEFIYNGSIWQEFGSGEARNGIYYGTGSLISGSILVSIPGFTNDSDYHDKLHIRVRMLQDRTGDGYLTMGINSLGVAPVYGGGISSGGAGDVMQPVPDGAWSAGEVVDFVLDYSVDGHAAWILVNGDRASRKAVKTVYDAATTNLAPVEASSTASANYAIGEHLVLGGVLYEVTAAIASGETITPGTNVTAATVTDITDAQGNRISTIESALAGLSSQLSQM